MTIAWPRLFYDNNMNLSTWDVSPLLDDKIELVEHQMQHHLEEILEIG